MTKLDKLSQSKAIKLGKVLFLDHLHCFWRLTESVLHSTLKLS